MPEERVKDKIKYAGNYYNSLSSNLKGFYDDYYSLTGKYLSITSGKRNSSNGVGKNSKISKHNTGDAIDVSANHTDDYRFLMNTKEGLDLLTKYGLGVIDETDPEELKKTGGTGAHFHIGKDSFYAKQVKERYNKMLLGDNIDEVIAYKDRASGENKKVTVVSNSAGMQTEVKVPNKAIQDFGYTPLDMRVAEKEIIKDAKMDDDREELVQAQKEQDTKVNFLNEYKAHIQNTVDRSMEILNSGGEQPIQQMNVHENVPIQDYDPNRFVYNPNIEQQ